MMNCHQNKREKSIAKRASLALETALVFPLVLILILALAGAIRVEQEAMILAHALDQTSKEVALLLPIADILEKVADPEKMIRQWVPNETLAHIALDGLSDVAATVLASPFILNRVDTWVKEISKGQHTRPPTGARRLAIDIDSSKRSIWFVLSFKKNTLTGDYWEVVRSRAPIWNASLFKDNDKDDDDEDRDRIWELSNFERGLAFRRKFGGHLPQFYPVIAAWNGSEATSIKSMDWTAPTYSSPNQVERRLEKFVSDLALFEGAGGEGPEPGAIRRRRLILIIPDNEIAWKTQTLIDRWRHNASREGVTLDIREYGTSHKHVGKE